MQRWVCGLGSVLAGVLVAGCTSTKTVNLNSTPAGATVKVSANRNGPRNLTVGETPTLYDFSFGYGRKEGPTLYTVEFARPGYEAKTVGIDIDDAITALDVTLEREVVKEVPRFYLVVTGDKGYRLETRQVRAWVEDIEREGMAASCVVQLGDQQSILGLALSANGQTLYFSLAEATLDAQGRPKLMANLRSVRTAGGGITQVTSGQWLDSSPACSADGRYVYFNSNRIQLDKPDLYRISADKIGGLAVIRQSAEGASYQPSLSTNGLLSFTFLPRYQGTVEGERQVWTLGGPNEYPTQLRAGSMSAASPDGESIAYIGDDGQLWVMPTSGSNPIQLTSGVVNKDGKRHPAWSPDGRFILFASDAGKDNRDVANYDIWIIAADGTGLRQLTTNGSEDDYPQASPDGKFVYFSSNRGFKEGIWRIPFPHAPR